MNTLTVWPHYETQQLTSMDQVKAHFTEDCDYELNWLFLSTSGVHGSYQTLDDIEACDGTDEEDECFDEITVLIVCPRLVVMKYGHLPIDRADIPWLRTVVTKTIAGVAKSQAENRLD